MSQLDPDTGSALSGEPVEQTDATEQTAPVEERFVETDNAEVEDTTLADMYPDEAKAEPVETDDEDEESDPNVNDEGGENATDEEDEPDEPAIDAPHSWKADAKDKWNALPRDMQQYLSERETERERFVNTKAQEAAQARETVQQQAFEELAQFKEQQAQQYNSLLNQFLAPLQEPDERLLHTGNPQDHLTYQQQEAAYRRGHAQRQQLQQAMEQETAQAQQIREDQEKQATAKEVERLREAMPEWFEPDTRANLQKELGAIANSLGYPPELLPEANATDLLALKNASGWKAKADKWDAYQKSKMAGVRNAKRQPPTPNKPGNAAANGKSVDPLAALYPNG